MNIILFFFMNYIIYLTTQILIWIYIRMLSDGTRFYFRKFIPIIDNLIAAGPTFFSIVKKRFSRMKLTILIKKKKFLIFLSFFLNFWINILKNYFKFFILSIFRISWNYYYLLYIFLFRILFLTACSFAFF
jgi:hypothetical protein